MPPANRHFLPGYIGHIQGVRYLLLLITIEFFAYYLTASNGKNTYLCDLSL